MKSFYESLSEKDRRRYAAVEAEKLGHGGVEYLANLFECDPKTIERGHQDVAELPTDEAQGRVRKKEFHHQRPQGIQDHAARGGVAQGPGD